MTQPKNSNHDSSESCNTMSQSEEHRELNSYEERIQARRDRYQDLAAKAKAKSSAVYNRTNQMADAIPFGQPIHVGHHSEKRDRNYRDRIHNSYGQAFALQDKADYYEQKASSVGTGGISSDDPDAIKKLRAELADVQQNQERMKATNKAIRMHKTEATRIAALVAQGLTEALATELLKPDFEGRVGFASYSLSNNSANARRIAGRIAALEKRRQRVDIEQAGEGYTYRENTEENRVMFIFDGKPDEATREILKRKGFRWSPSRAGKRVGRDSCEKWRKLS